MKSAKNEQPTAWVGGIQKFSTEDGPGIRTTVFLMGCPLNCSWCHNPELIAFQQQVIQLPNSCIDCGYCVAACPNGAIAPEKSGGVSIDRSCCTQCLTCVQDCYSKALQPVATRMTSDEVLDIVAQDKSFYDHTGGGMTVSGGEILSQPIFTEALVDGAAARGIRVCLDTSGHGDTAALLRLVEKKHVTHVLYDMKCIERETHRRYTGQDNDTILRNLITLAANTALRDKIIMRMPLIHNVNDSPAIISSTIAFYAEHGLRKLHLLPYHTLGISKQRHIGGTQMIFETPNETLLNVIQERFIQEAHMEVSILGK